MKAQGIGATEIAEALGIGRASVYRVLDTGWSLTSAYGALVSRFRPEQARLRASEPGHAHLFLPPQ
jgi:hypothetical protein